MSINFVPHPEIAIPNPDTPHDPLAHGPQYKAVYKYDYAKIGQTIKAGQIPAKSTYRQLILTDLFFIVFFVLGIQKANHPFVVRMCQIVESGPPSGTLDVWARGHWKSTTITIAETLQYHLKNPDKCTAILAYARPAAKKFLRSLKELCATSDLLKWTFDDVLWQNPTQEAPKWSEDDGIVFKGRSSSRGESTIEAWGLTEGMPTGRHFERLVFDDIETEDIANSPDILNQVFSKFDMASMNLGTMSDDDVVRVIGTYYNHNGPVKRIGDMKLLNGDKIYNLRIVPATDDGTAAGNPVYEDPETWERSKTSQHFNSQKLCNPTPQGDTHLDFAWMKPIEPEFIPQNRLKFIIIDPAGDKDIRANNSGSHSKFTAICISVKTVMDDLGLSEVYLEDVESDEMGLSEQVDAGVNLYCRNGKIQLLGVEQTANDTTYDHIRKGLKGAGRHITMLEGKKASYGSMILLRPAGRDKAKKINSALTWPLKNGKVFYSTDIPKRYIDVLKEEFDKHPFYNVDILECMAYLYDILTDYEFDRQGAKPAKTVLQIMNQYSVRSDFS
jgi:hypothetical protein